MTDYKMHLLICGGTGCKASESDEIQNKLNYFIDEFDLKDEVQVVLTGCFGFCEKGPIIKVLPDNTFYVRVTQDDAEDIINLGDFAVMAAQWLENDMWPVWVGPQP